MWNIGSLLKRYCNDFSRPKIYRFESLHNNLKRLHISSTNSSSSTTSSYNGRCYFKDKLIGDCKNFNGSYNRRDRRLGLRLNPLWLNLYSPLPRDCRSFIRTDRLCFTSSVPPLPDKLKRKDQIVQLGSSFKTLRKIAKLPIYIGKYMLLIPFRVGKYMFYILKVSYRGVDKVARFAARAVVVEKVSGVPGIFKVIIGGIKHTIHWCKTGSKLYAANVKVSYYILKKWMRGHPVRYNERKLLMRTLNDALKMVPFSLFIIVPFAEFLLPVAIRLFPALLPSTFQTRHDNDSNYLQKKLAAKQELAKFFQELIQERTNQILQEELDSSLRTKAEALKQFQERLLNKDDLDMNPFLSANELLVFSKLFKKEFVLDKMSLETLKVMCKLLGITPFSIHSHVVLQLRHHLLKIQREDRLIMWEGVESLTFEELQEACRERAMKFYNVTKEQMQQQLQQWMDLSSMREISPILLLWSRCITMTHEPMYIKDVTVSEEEVPEEVSTTTYKIPENIDISTKSKVVQDVVEAAKIDVEHLHESEERLEELSLKAKELQEEIIEDTAEIICDTNEPDTTTKRDDNNIKKQLRGMDKEELLLYYDGLVTSLDLHRQISDMQNDQLSELFSYLIKTTEKAKGDVITLNYNDVKTLLDSTRKEFKKIEELNQQFNKIYNK